MSNININRNTSDQFYRYKMPKLLAKVEGKGNGIKTVVENMVDIAKALNRPPTYPTKYFGCELGAQTQCDTKNDRFIVNGSHEAAKLQDLLHGFIKRYVLCASCDNPETLLEILPRKGVVNSKCIACGYNGQVDSKHRLTSFILKNPPGQDPAKVANSSKKSKRKTKEKGSKQSQNGEGESRPHHDSDGESKNLGKEEEDDDWCDGTSAEAIAKRLESLTGGAKGLILNDDLDKPPQERLDIFYSFVKKRQEEGALVHKEVVCEADRLNIRDKAVLVLCELLFSANILAEVKAQRALFLRFTHDNRRAQKYLLGGLEQVVNLHKDSLLPKVPHILKVFYDYDILDEEVLLNWEVSRKYVAREVALQIHSKAEPFIKWLQEAEEEESDEEEVVYSNEIPKKAVVQPRSAEDDLDIDAI